METTARERGRLCESLDRERVRWNLTMPRRSMRSTRAFCLAGKSFSHRARRRAARMRPIHCPLRRCGRVPCRSAKSRTAILGFGRHLWQVGDIAPCEALGNLRSTAVEISARAKRIYQRHPAHGRADRRDGSWPRIWLSNREPPTAVPLTLPRGEMYGSIVTDASGGDRAKRTRATASRATRFPLPR